MGHKVYVVGLGPGDGVYLTLQARAALEAADVLCGYTAYVALAAAQFPCKETYATGMREEIERCRWALATAAQGKTVALVCSGDAGVYGMAGLLLQMGKEFTDVDIEVVPGVTAALSGAALLGAPLGHDFCVISLSDLLTPWDVILFCVCITLPPANVRTICAGPAMSCFPLEKRRIRCAVWRAILAGRAKGCTF